jgi:histidinol dehydrogenase
MSAIKIIPAQDLSESFFSVRRLSGGLDEVPVILEAVRVHGDSGVRTYAAKYDRANPESFEISSEALKGAEDRLRAGNPSLYSALCLSRDLALKFATRQRDSFDDFEIELSPGLFTGQRTIPVERAGLYVPGGRFALVSSVIMCATPAKAAGVGEIVFCTPPVPHPEDPALPWADESILAAASLCGIDRVFAIGGAQAIAAMAYGTESVPRVNAIVGPGNKYVAQAKKLVFGEVGIDLLAGPTEVMVIADDSAHPAWIAADLLAQAEHDPDAQAVLVTASEPLARAVAAEVSALVDALPEGAPARKSLGANGLIVLVRELADAIAIANRKAPEHLELALDPGEERDAIEAEVRNYGSLFVGHRTAEVLGDYAAGLNHTLPTSGSALFTGGLSVRHFLKTVTTLRTAENGLATPAAGGAGLSGDPLSGWRASVDAAETIATAEGLSGHALAARLRRS